MWNSTIVTFFPSKKGMAMFNLLSKTCGLSEPNIMFHVDEWYKTQTAITVFVDNYIVSLAWWLHHCERTLGIYKSVNSIFSLSQSTTISLVHEISFQRHNWSFLISRQCSSFRSLFGSPSAQFENEILVPVVIHVHWPSFFSSVAPIQQPSKKMKGKKLPRSHEFHSCGLGICVLYD